MNRALVIIARENGEMVLDSGGIDLTNPEHLKAARAMLKMADDALVDALLNPAQEAADDAPDSGDAGNPAAG